MTGDTMIDAHVRGYAQAVRIHLADLGPDVVEDLAGGLESDLAEAVADRLPAATDGDDVVLDLTRVFGHPSQYATELRTAAGLPLAVASRRRPGRVRAALRARGARLVQSWRRAWEPLTSTPGWQALREALDELTPVWWVARGWLLGSFVSGLFGSNGEFLVVPSDGAGVFWVVVGVVLSVQWGRGRWMPWRWMPRFVVLASVVALVTALPMSLSTQERIEQGDGNLWSQGYNAGLRDAEAGGVRQGSPVAWGDVSSPSGMDGVWVDGMQVSNIFAYDANGDPLRGVQLFDDRGRPVRTVAPDQEWQPWAVPDVDGQWFFRPSVATDGRLRWNVFPLQALAETDLEVDESTGEPRAAVGARPQQMPWPFLKAPTAIAQPTPTPTPEPETPAEPDAKPDAEPGAQPDAKPDAEPGAQPEPTPSADPARQPVVPSGGPVPVVVADARR